MKNHEAENNLQFIKEMIDKTKKGTAHQWKFLSLWGIAVIFGVAGMNILVLIKKYEFIWMNWALFMGLAVVVQIFLVRKEIHSDDVRTYAQGSIAHLCFSSGIAYALAGFVLPLMKVYDFTTIPIIISVITGILLFTVGGILEWNYLKWSGILWFAASVALIYFRGEFGTLLFIPLILITYLVPAYILKKRYREDH